MLNKKMIKQLQKTHTVNPELISMFNALGDPNRYKIFCILLEQDGICVSEFAEILGVSTPAASQQLSFLEQAKLIKRIRHGQMICYQVQIENSAVDVVASLICNKVSTKPKKTFFKSLLIGKKTS